MSVDLLTVAQALHWFEVDGFHREAQRVHGDGDVLAVWGRADCTEEDPTIAAEVHECHHQALAAHWPPERAHDPLAALLARRTRPRPVTRTCLRTILRTMTQAAAHELRSVDDLRCRLADLGARPVHVRRLLRTWLAGHPLGTAPDPQDARAPRRLTAGLPRLQALLEALIAEVLQAEAADGSCRRLLRLRSGRTVESVDLPRAGLCVSTQVGCAVGCGFCRTGEEGLVQQLSPLEILAQVVFARRRRVVRRVVFMGMGEPAHNLEAVCEAIATLGTEGEFGHKSLVFSTVGDARVFDLLAEQRVRPALALSLHTLDASKRATLLPRAPVFEPAQLLGAALDYADRIAHPLLVQWTLLEGVNDDEAQVTALAERLHGRRAIVNFIPFNAVEGSGFERPSIEACVRLVRAVRRCGVLATLRFSAGQEVEAGCGQLRARRSGPTTV